VIVLSHPTQYYSPWFRWMTAHATINLHVIYLWDFGVTEKRDPSFQTNIQWDVDLLSGYSREFVPNTARCPGAESFFGFSNPGLTKHIAKSRPHALLLFGYNWASHLKVIAWASLAGIPLILRGDSHLIGRSSPKAYKQLALRTLFSRFAAFLYVGAANRNYFEVFGVPSRKLFFAPHSVDAELFDRKRPGCLEAAVALRRQLGIADGTRVVLFSGKLLPAKQPVELFEAFADIDAPDTALVFVGDGPERERLQSVVARHKSKRGSASVHMLPFANQSEMPSRYLLADLYVLPSRGSFETWGLAVNEAMHMGVPCLVSNRVGCQRDLVTEGETGWVFDAEDGSGMRRSLALALQTLAYPGRKDEIVRAVEQRISGYNYAQTTDGLISAMSSLPT
jgi:glycosyltransferase involved in cell wall biosynthesis